MSIVTPSVTVQQCRVVHAGRMSFQAAWELQRTLIADRSAGRCGDTLLLLEHPPTITLGRAANHAHVLVDPQELARRGVDLVATDRGGDVTYHAPGQIVGYPILKLARYGGGLLGYLRRLEETLIQTLATYDVAARRVPGLTGVWVNGDRAKIAAIGVRLSASGVTSHGFALNVNPDLQGFTQIVPCGIGDRAVTSLAACLGTPPPPHEVTARLLACFAAVFQVELV